MDALLVLIITSIIRFSSADVIREDVNLQNLIPRGQVEHQEGVSGENYFVVKIGTFLSLDTPVVVFSG